MRRAQLLFPFVLALALISVLVPLYAHAQDPDFSNTMDILNGQRHMLRADDVAVVYQGAAQQAPYTSTLYTDSYLTENSQVTQGQYLTATATGASALANVQVQAAMGRMFDQATDVLAVAAQEADPANPNGRSLFVTIYDRANSRSQRVLVMDVETELVPASLLMADFTGDGYDDLAVSFNQAATGEVAGFTAIVTAADPQNWAAGLVVGPLYTSQPIPVTAFADMTAAERDLAEHVGCPGRTDKQCRGGRRAGGLDGRGRDRRGGVVQRQLQPQHLYGVGRRPGAASHVQRQRQRKPDGPGAGAL